MPEQTHPTGAVFISYCSEDAPAAERICEALRAVGIDVWLDKSELRGGDAWDAQIKKHIHDCALFIPVISAQTNARSEGYFRREWKQATRRLQDMADDLAFLVPVVIDQTREADARVPEEFLRAQWTWLPGGETPPAFAQRVRQLLGGNGATSQPATTVGTGAGGPVAAARGRARPGVRTIGLALGVLALLLGAGTLWYFQSRRDTTATLAPTPEHSGVAVTAPNDKSIAVLPFTDMSEKKDHEYFSDGLSEELIDQLAQITELRVIARSSSFAFKGINEDARSIATKLGVTNLLQGSVRKAGSQLRISAQLVRASDGALLWSETYVRKLDDIFELQDEISTRVANALNATLNAPTAIATQSASRGTANVEAYNLLLRGNFHFWRGNKGDEAKSIEFFQQALKLDPQYATAWAKLGRAYVWQGNIGELSTAEAKAKSRDAVGRALAIDPNCAEAYFVRGNSLRVLDGEWSAAISDFERAAALDPHGEVGDSGRGNAKGLKAHMTGRFKEILEWGRRRREQSPLDTETMIDAAEWQQVAGQLDESAETSRRLLEINPVFAGAWAQYGFTLLLMGKHTEALAAAEKETDDALRLMTLAIVHWAMRQRAESDAAIGKLEHRFSERSAYLIAGAHAYRGDTQSSFTWLDRAYRQRKGSVGRLKIDPLFQGMRGDPRYTALLRQVKLQE